ncbi:MAG: hypothetical protein U1B83_10135, partial [Candidatus Cloacimonadaceae bacterium]|nr:hypothetical protein [Candidatus Cloacimonadaceae bacterium]
MLKKVFLALTLVLALGLGWAQGLETFQNFPATGSSYSSGTFTGMDGSTWNYTQCRGDYVITAKALMIGRNLTPQSNVYSGTISGGIGTISFDYSQAFSTAVNMNVLVNDVVVGNVTATSQQGAILNSGTITVNVGGDFVLKFINVNNSDGQVVIDNISWTGYSAATPMISATGVLNAFNTYTGTPSAAQSYTLSGANLTAGINISAPAGYHISTDGGTNYVASGSVANTFNGLIYVRLTGATAGNYSGNITHTSTGAPQVDKFVTGTVSDPTTLLLEENFAYTAGTTLASNGWTAHSGAGSNSPTVVAGNLSYTGYPSITGNMAQTYATGEDVHRTFQPQTTGSVYASVLVNVDTAYATGDYLIHFGPSPIGSTFRNRLFIQKHATEATYRFGLSNAGALATAVWTDYLYNTGTTYLLVMKYDFVEGSNNDQVHLFVNPNFSGIEPAYTLTATDAITSEPTNIGAFAIRQGTNAASALAKIDGIRIANSWDNLWGLEFNSVIHVTGTLEDFFSNVGVPSASQSYYLSGEELGANLSVVAPAGFQLSTDEETWHQALSLAPSFAGDVFVRFLPTQAIAYAGNIEHTSGTATPVNLAVYGEGSEVLGEIVVNTSPLTFSGVSGTPTAPQQVNVSGTNLAYSIYATVNAPFQIRMGSAGVWSQFVEMPNTYNGILEIRFNPTTGGTFNQTLTFESEGASNKYIQLSGSATVAVANIAALRASATGSTVYTLTGEAVLTFKQTFRNQKFIQDATAAILVDDLNNIITTVYNIGDGITGISGTLTEFGGMKQFTPTANP